MLVSKKKGAPPMIGAILPMAGANTRLLPAKHKHLQILNDKPVSFYILSNIKSLKGKLVLLPAKKTQLLIQVFPSKIYW